MIIGLVGFKNSGKDTVGRYLVNEHGFDSFAFADSIKDCLSSIFDWDREMMEGRNAESRKWREKVDEWWSDKLGIPNFTPRYAMQHFGTDLMRNQFHTDIWLFNIEKRIVNSKKPIVITDTRFPNEIAMLKNHHANIVRIKRGPEPQWFGKIDHTISHKITEEQIGVHYSEWAWTNSDLDDTIVNSGDVKTLHSETSRVLASLRAFV